MTPLSDVGFDRLAYKKELAAVFGKSRRFRRSHRKKNLRGNQGLWLGEVQQHHIRTLLHSFEDDFTAIWRDVEVANVEVGSEMSQLLLGAGLHVDQPKILMLNLSSQKHECPSPAQEGQVPSSASQGKGWQRTRYGLGRDGFHRKRGTDVGSRVDNKAAIGRPYGIDRVFLD